MKQETVRRGKNKGKFGIVGTELVREKRVVIGVLYRVRV